MEIIFKGNITNQNTINYFNDKDLNLIGTENIINNFNPDIDYIEYIIYNAANDLLNINSDYNSFKLPSQGFNLNNNSSYNVLEIDPIKDLQQYYNIGEFKTQYNFFKPWISDYNNLDLFVKDISSDRTELRISSVNITNLKEQLDLLLIDKNSVSYLKTYLLNFGNNNLQLLTNIQWDGEYIIVKLYNELPDNISINDSLFIVEELTNVIFQLDLSNEFILDPLPNLKGPNFEIDINNKITSPTKYESHNSLLSNYSGSSIQTILNQINLAEIEINIDYTNFENFTRFSSVETRLNNFYNKVKQIEDYNTFITNYSGSSQSNIRLQIGQYSSSINEIVTKFDGYENYLYFNSGSTTWPKNNINPPYTLESTGSVNVVNWFQSIIDESIYFDTNNPDQLINAIPEYITVDENNLPYINFINMIGHYFDNIWIYIKSITDYYESYNNPNEGISKDLVFFALQDLGVKLYNTKEDDDLYNYILGNNGNSSSQQLIAELYKRIYHNIPLLFKGKGSSKNIQELITTFGITGSILKIKEYGGNSNTKASLLDYSEDKVRIVNNTIYSASYGSILHPNLKLSDYIYENYKNDDSRIDVAFSPQNQLDIAISSSVINSYPNFNIDDYIGDPRYELSGSYSDLNNIRYNAISSSFTASYDIRGFIELIQYFDNTLFKMIEDYIPAKSNLSKGIVIKSQALERIKWKRQLPVIENQTQYDVNYSTASLNSDYDKFYDSLQGDKKPYYDGEISGSDKNLYNEYFIPNNLNPYIISSSFNLTLFNKSDYNVLLNNVEDNTLSLVRKKIEIQPYSSQSVLVESEIQDSNYYDTGLNKSRYDGTKLISSKYNDYTDGDIAFGKTSVIDIIKNNVSYFTNINSSTLLLSNISELNLKYLINDQNNVIDLNDQNNNVNDIQNIFKSGEKITISYLNESGSIKPSNQDIEIYKGGYTLNTPLYSLDGLSYKHYELPNAINSDVNVNYNLSTLNHYVTQSGILSYHVYRNGIYYSVEPKKLKEQEQPYVISSQLYLRLVYPSPVTASYYTKLLYDNNIVANVFLSASETSVAPVFNTRYFNYNGYIPLSSSASTLFDSSSFSFEGQSPTNKFKHGGRIYVSSGYGDGNGIYYPNTGYSNYFLNSGSFPIKISNKTIQFPQIISDNYSYIRYNNSSINEPLFNKDNYNYLNIKIGDKFAFYPIDFTPTVGAYWNNKTFIFTEYDITKVYFSGSDNKLYMDVNQNLPEFKTKNANDSNLEYIPFYIIRSIDPNETSILLKSTNFNEFNRQGIVYPQYVNKILKTKSGDIIKNLKSQNLI